MINRREQPIRARQTDRANRVLYSHWSGTCVMDMQILEQLHLVVKALAATGHTQQRPCVTCSQHEQGTAATRTLPRASLSPTKDLLLSAEARTRPTNVNKTRSKAALCLDPAQIAPLCIACLHMRNSVARHMRQATLRARSTAWTTPPHN
jgi:hypothetical protein